MAPPIMFNGIQFAPVSSKNSIVVPVSGDVLWSVLGKFGRMALWMGSVEGQPIYTQLLGGEAADYVGAVRIFGVGDKMLFEQLTRLDQKEMIMAWQLTTHPMNSNPFPAAFLNCKASMQVIPISIPGGSAVAEWRVDCLTELQHVAHMTKALDDIMIHSFTNLLKFMQKSINSSEGASSVSAKTSDIRGSLSAPSAFGVQYMPQPNPAQTHFQTQPFSQAMHPSLTGGTPLLQQPSFVPAPESTSGTSEKQFQQQNIPPEVYQHFPQQQVLQQQIPHQQQLQQQLQQQQFQQQQQLQQQQQFQQQHQQLQQPQHNNSQQQQHGYNPQHPQHLLQQLHQQQLHQQQHQQQQHQQQQPQQHQQEKADGPEVKDTS